MPGDILIIKKKGGKVSVKITKKMRNGYAPPSFSQTINLENYKDLVFFLHDLEDLYGAPMEKAVKHYLYEKDNGWPFF